MSIMVFAGLVGMRLDKGMNMKLLIPLVFIMSGCDTLIYEAQSCDNLSTFLSCYNELIQTDDIDSLYDHSGRKWTLYEGVRYCSDLSGYAVNLVTMTVKLDCEQ